MKNPRPQRYTLTAEIVLADRGDYAAVRKDILEQLKSWEAHGLIKVDYIALEKTKDG